MEEKLSTQPSKHEQYQAAVLEEYDVPLRTNISQTAAFSLIAGAYMFATKLVFGMEQNTEGNLLKSNPLGWNLYNQLALGNNGKLLASIALHHHWSNARHDDAFEVYPGEWLVVDAPANGHMWKFLATI